MILPTKKVATIFLKERKVANDFEVRAQEDPCDQPSWANRRRTRKMRCVLCKLYEIGAIL